MSPPSHEPVMSRATRYSVVFLFLFSLALAAGNYLFTANLVNRATAASASVVQLCEAGNEARAQQVQLWEFLITVSRPPPHETAAEKARREKTVRLFIAHIHHVFAPRDCHKE